jgi:hypothetical protein
MFVKIGSAIVRVDLIRAIVVNEDEIDILFLKSTNDENESESLTVDRNASNSTTMDTILAGLNKQEQDK